MASQTEHFDNPASALTYADNARRMVPGLADLHRMALILMSENAHRAADEARHALCDGASPH